MSSPASSAVRSPSEVRDGASRALPSYSQGLDGLRAVAMLGMLLYHAEFGWAKGGFLGIPQFFTLSGFLITSILLRGRESAQGLDMKKFWVQRYRRLMPASFLTLAGMALFGATVATEQQLDQIPGHVASALAQVANWHFIFSDTSYVEMFSAPSPVQHFWSLAIEEQFYLLMPAGLYLLLRRNSSLKTIGAVFAGLALASVTWSNVLFERGASIDRLYYGTDTRAPELLVGCLLAVILHARPLQPTAAGRRFLAAGGVLGLGFAFWAWPTVALTDSFLYRGGFMVYSVAAALLILSLLADTGPAAALLRWKPLAAGGRITYGVYLYHWPVFLWLTPERTGLSLGSVFVVRAAVTLALSIASYHLVEMPIREQRFRFAAGRLKWAAAPAAAFILTGAVLAAQRDVETNLAGLGEEVSAAPVAARDDPVLDVLVIADGTGSPMTDELKARDGESDELTVTFAPPFSCQSVETVEGRPLCSNWRDEWPTALEQAEPDVILLHVTDWTADDLSALSGITDPEALTPWARDVLDAGLDLLTADGTTVLWNQRNDGPMEEIARQEKPFFRAMKTITDERRDVLRRWPLYDDADELLGELELHRRRDPGDLPRVLVVGDSVSRTLGYGLENWTTEEGNAVVWSAGTEGCGIANEGLLSDSSGREIEVSDVCREAPDTFAAQVAEFDPDLVIVMSAYFDLQLRKLPGWSDWLAPGDDTFDEYLAGEYVAAYDTLSAGGARVIWVNAPCMPARAGMFRDAKGGWSGEPARVAAHNDVILPRVVETRPEIRVFDMYSILCPGDEAVEEIGGIDDFRPDGFHFSPEAAVWLGKEYGEEFLDLGLG